MPSALWYGRCFVIGMRTASPTYRVVSVNATELGPREARNLLTEVRSLRKEPVDVVILDLARVAFIDSLGLAAIATIVEETRSPRRVVIAGAQQYVVRMIHMTRLHEVADVYATVAAATGAFAAA